MDAISEASFQMCTRKPKSPKACKWFDKDTKEALKQMHKDRQRARIYPSPHNILRAQTSNKQYKYQIKRAKRSHAMAYASTVNTTTDLWALNKWYRGIRKSIMPALKRKDLSWASNSKAKADLLSKTWFPNMHFNVYILSRTGIFHVLFALFFLTLTNTILQILSYHPRHIRSNPFRLLTQFTDKQKTRVLNP